MQALAANNQTTSTTSKPCPTKPPRTGGRPARAPSQTKRANPNTHMFTEISNSDRDYVPCLYLPSGAPDRLLIFFHGNGEDLGMIYATCDRFRTELCLNVLAVEYPNYGVYEDPSGASEEKILSDAELVYTFVQDVAKIEESDIIVMGRSLGSGPASHLAAKYNPASLVLLSPLTSIKSVASESVGFFSALLAQ